MKKEQLLLIAKDGGKLVYGALGDLEKCNGYEESLSLDGDHGYLTKYFGIKTPYKGWIDNERIGKVNITKRAFLELIRALWWRPRTLLRSLISVYSVEDGLIEWRLRDEEFCPAIQEMIRVLKGVVIEELYYTLAMFMYFSPTYRLWLQDIFGELDKDRFLKSPTGELLRLKRLFMSRYKSGNPERRKVNMLWLLVIAWVILNGKSAKNIIKELNIDKVRIDDMDWYYCLRRKSYDFRGLTLRERLKLVGKRDKLEGNIILEI